MKNYILTGTAAVVLLFTLPLFGGGEANNNAAVAAETVETAADSLTMPLPEGSKLVSQIKLLTWTADEEDRSGYIQSGNFFAYIYFDTKASEAGLCFWDEQNEVDVYGLLKPRSKGESVRWSDAVEQEQFEMHLLWDNSEEFPPAECTIYVAQYEGHFCYRFVITGQMGLHVFEGVEVKSALGE